MAEMAINDRDTHFANLFDNQIAKLTTFNCPKDAVAKLSSKRDEVFQNWHGSHWSNCIAFLPVIPSKDLNFLGFRNNGQGSLENVKNVVDTPDEPYYIYDIDDQSWTCGFEIKGVMKSNRKRGQRGLTFAEVVSFNLHYWLDSKNEDEKEFDKDVSRIAETILINFPIGTSGSRETTAVTLKKIIGDRIRHRYEIRKPHLLIVATGSRFRGSDFTPCLSRGYLDFVSFCPGTYSRGEILVPSCRDEKPAVIRHVKIEEDVKPVNPSFISRLAAKIKNEPMTKDENLDEELARVEEAFEREEL